MRWTRNWGHSPDRESGDIQMLGLGAEPRNPTEHDETPASPDRRPKRLLRRGTIGKGAALASLGALVVSTQALAAGFMIRENSAIAVGTVYAGNGSRADAPSTVFNNPAGMTRLTDDEVEGGIAVILPSIKFNGSASAGGKPVSGVDA